MFITLQNTWNIVHKLYGLFSCYFYAMVLFHPFISLKASVKICDCIRFSLEFLLLGSTHEKSHIGLEGQHNFCLSLFHHNNPNNKSISVSDFGLETEGEIMAESVLCVVYSDSWLSSEPLQWFLSVWKHCIGLLCREEHEIMLVFKGTCQYDKRGYENPILMVSGWYDTCLCVCNYCSFQDFKTATHALQRLLLLSAAPTESPGCLMHNRLFSYTHSHCLGLWILLHTSMIAAHLNLRFSIKTLKNHLQGQCLKT